MIQKGVKGLTAILIFFILFFPYTSHQATAETLTYQKSALTTNRGDDYLIIGHGGGDHDDAVIFIKFDNLNVEAPIEQATLIVPTGESSMPGGSFEGVNLTITVGDQDNWVDIVGPPPNLTSHSLDVLMTNPEIVNIVHEGDTYPLEKYTLDITSLLSSSVIGADGMVTLALSSNDLYLSSQLYESTDPAYDFQFKLIVTYQDNNAPTDLNLSSSTINQSSGIDTEVGSLTTVDADFGDSHTYSLVSGSGDTNNALFNISGSALRVNNAASIQAGTYEVRIRTTDSSGEYFEKSFTITVIDDIAPSVPIITTTQYYFNQAKPTISGTGEPNSTVQIHIAGISGYEEVSVLANGDWTYTPSTDLADDDYSITARAKDLANNLSAFTSPYTITIDTEAPPKPVITVPGNGALLASSTPTISGTSEADNTITVYGNSTTYGTVTANANGQWTLTLTSELPDGQYDFTAIATDLAGNESEMSSTISVLIDTTPPAAPIITSPADGGYTNNAKPNISGTAEAESTISIYINGIMIGTTTTNQSHSWTYTPVTDLVQGLNTIHAYAMDAAGHTSEKSDDVIVEFDNEDPVAPTILSPANNSVSNQQKPTISGSSEAKNTISIYINGSLDGTVTSDPITGMWSYTVANNLVEGEHEITATSTDPAGNESPLSSAIKYTVDVTPPATPIVTTPIGNVMTKNAVVQIQGTSDSDNQIYYYVNGSLIAYVNANGNGEWTIVHIFVGEGTYELTIKAVDAAGNESLSEATVQFDIDQTAPDAPIITALAPFINAVKPEITGTAEAGSKVELFRNGVSIADNIVVAIDGTWSFRPTVNWNDGAYSLHAIATDLAGNVSLSSTPISFTIDTVVPDEPVISTDLNNTSMTNKRPVIEGTALALHDIELTINGQQIPLFSSDLLGNWTYTPTADLADGNYVVTAKVIDQAGNYSIDSNTISFTIDTVAPAAPIITTTALYTNDNRPTITGTAEPLSELKLINTNDASEEIIAVDADGNWTYRPDSALIDEIYTFVAVAKDAAGNESSQSSYYVFTLDTVAPATPVISTVLDQTNTSIQTPTIEGSAEPNSEVELFNHGQSIATVSVDGSGNWSFTPASNWSDGTYIITATATDRASNRSVTSSGISFTIDTVAPAAPIISSPLANAYINLAKPSISGEAEANSQIELDIDGNIALVNADQDGNWSYTPLTNLLEGTHTIIAKAFDAAGNESIASLPLSFNVDTIAPIAPTINSPAHLSLHNQARPTISGTAEVGSKVLLFVDTILEASINTDASGIWSYTPTGDWADKTYTITAIAEDAASNQSTVSPALDITIDTEAPVIQLIGDTNVRTEVGVAYTDAGATALDSREGNISSKINTISTVDINTIGHYTVTYKVTDDAGNEAVEVQRQVTVIPPVVHVVGSNGGNKVTVSNAIAGASLKLYNAGNQQVGDLQTADADGKYTFTNVPKGSGYYVTQIISTVESNPSTSVNVTQPSAVEPSPAETRQANLIIINTKFAFQLPIERKYVNGQSIDEVELNADNVQTIIKEAVNQNHLLITVYIDDLVGNPANNIDISINRDALNQFAINGIELELQTDHGAIRLTTATIQALVRLDQEAYFRIIPIRDVSDQLTNTERVVNSVQVRHAAGDRQVKLTSIPVKIETNYTNVQTKVIIPIDTKQLPTQPQLLQQLLASLSVYVEHSDGEKKVQLGEVVYDLNGKPIGIEIEINKFSTFTGIGFISNAAHSPYISGYGDGIFAPNRAITRAELATMLSRLFINEKVNDETNTFTDVSAAHWAYSYITHVQKLGLINGYPDQTFRPDQQVTRAEFASAISTLLASHSSSISHTLTDITQHWANDSILKVLTDGIMKGYADHTFRPNGQLTRAEAVTALNRLTGRQPLYNVSNPYTDLTNEHWAFGEIMEASTEHLDTDH